MYMCIEIFCFVHRMLKCTRIEHVKTTTARCHCVIIGNHLQISINKTIHKERHLSKADLQERNVAWMFTSTRTLLPTWFKISELVNWWHGAADRLPADIQQSVVKQRASIVTCFHNVSCRSLTHLQNAMRAFAVVRTHVQVWIPISRWILSFYR